MRVSTSTDGLPPAERFAALRDAVAHNPYPGILRCEDPLSFSGQISSSDFGTMTLLSMSTRAAGGCALHRTARLIRRSDPEEYRLVLHCAGPASSMMAHYGQERALRPGDLTLVHSSSPFHGWRGPGLGRFVWLRIPRESLPVSAPAVHQLLGGHMDGRAGIGSLVSGFMVRAARDIETYRPDEALRLSTVLLDLVGSLLAHELEADDAVPPDSQQRVLLHRIHAFIQRHLGDPRLSPATVAAAHHISVRTLHRIFEAQDTTVAAWIRARRLDRCHRDLADPGARQMPIHAIAARWGFTDAPHFTRAFTATYGLSPSDYRRRQQACRSGT